MNNKSEKRLRIISLSEYKKVYERPVFTASDRNLFFKLDEVQLSHVVKSKSITVKVFFILQLGYFKCSSRFFKFDLLSCKQDSEYIIEHYFNNYDFKSLKITCAENTILKQRQEILNFLSFKSFTEFEEKFIDKVRKIAKIDTNPKYIFKELLLYSHKFQFIFPAYSTVQKIISKILIEEENRIFELLTQLLDTKLKDDIDSLIEKESKTRYLLTLIKSPASGFSYSSVLKELKKKESLQEIYQKSQIIITKLGISNSTVRYLARLIDTYTIQQIKKFSKRKQYLYILCFTHYQYKKINNNLIKTFLFLMGKYKSNVIDEVNKSILAIKTEQNKNSKKVPEILDLIVIKYKYHQEFQDKVYSILAEKKIKELSNYLAKTSFDKKLLNWMAYDKQYTFINRNVKRLFKTLDFSYHSTADFYTDFFNAIEFVKKGKYKTLSTDDVPAEFIQK